MAAADEVSTSDDALFEARKQLLTTALGDIKGSIHANDQKVSAALVVNGLLLTSVVTVVTHTGTNVSSFQSRRISALRHRLTIGAGGSESCSWRASLTS